MAGRAQELRTARFRGPEDKLAGMGQMFAGYLHGDVLDVGCGARLLAARVDGRYVGVDREGRPDVCVNLERPLPFRDKSVDAVVAFDVLEHLDHAHAAFDELCRVARRHILIGLPNMYEWHFRLLFLLGKRLSGKYGLPAAAQVDRHRWLYGLAEARAFVRERAARNGFAVTDEVLAYYAYHRPLARLVTHIGRRLAPRLASLFAYHYWAVLTRRG